MADQSAPASAEPVSADTRRRDRHRARVEKLSPNQIADAIAKLSPADAQHFIGVIDASMRRRRLQLWGYLLSMVLWTIGMFAALWAYGAAADGTFIIWVFLVPFGLLGGTLWFFGWLGDKLYALRTTRDGV